MPSTRADFCNRLLTGPSPIGHPLVDNSSLGKVVREDLGRGFNDGWKSSFQRLSNPRVQCSAWSTQQCAIGRILHQRMLE
jgi:hypothetical protein